jgi:hypothetical protein
MPENELIRFTITIEDHQDSYKFRSVAVPSDRVEIVRTVCDLFDLESSETPIDPAIRYFDVYLENFRTFLKNEILTAEEVRRALEYTLEDLDDDNRRQIEALLNGESDESVEVFDQIQLEVSLRDLRSPDVSETLDKLFPVQT